MATKREALQVGEDNVFQEKVVVIDFDYLVPSYREHPSLLSYEEPGLTTHEVNYICMKRLSLSLSLSLSLTL